MKVRIGSDEFTLYYCSDEVDEFLGAIVELPAYEYVDYKRVEAEHEAWQKRLHQLFIGENK